MKKFLLLLIAVNIWSCRKIENTSQPSAIIGNGEFLPYNEAQNNIGVKIQENIGAVGILDSECTVFHVGDGLVLTAGHCFAEGVKSGDPCITNRIQWQDGLKSQCVQVLEHAYTENKDYAVIEVDPVPESVFQVAVERSYGDFAVIGYPKDQGLTVSLDCGENQIRDSIGDPNKIFHDCDSLPGNSGSPIFSTTDWKVIGVHNGHDQPFNYGTSLATWQMLRENALAIRQDRNDHSMGTPAGPFSDNEKRLIHHISSTIPLANISIQNGC